MFQFLKNSFFGFKDEEKNYQFNLWQYTNSAKQIQYILSLTGSLYIIMGIINLYVFTADIYQIVIFLQIFLIPSYIFLVAFLAYKKIEFQILETLLFLAPVFAASLHCFIFMQLDHFSTYQTELYLMIFWTLTISGLRFQKAIVVSMIILIIGEWYPYTFYKDQQTQFILHTMWMFVSLFFGILGGAIFHKSKKDTFIKELELQSLAEIDKLTGLYNRVKLDYVLPQELNRAQRYSDSVGILILDIDFFKKVNDTYGHLVGDQVLINVAKTLKYNLRTSDYLFRWGGEEFLIICLNITQTDLLNLANKIRIKIAQEHFKDVGNVTISIGATLNNSVDTIESILSRADDALYEAKNTGRDKVCTR